MATKCWPVKLKLQVISGEQRCFKPGNIIWALFIKSCDSHFCFCKQLARLRHFVPLNTLQHIYRSLIQPYLLYGITAWAEQTKLTHRNKILRLHKRALRLMFFCDYKTHAVPFFISSSLLSLDLLYFKPVAILMHDVSNNTSSPQISNLFNYQHNIHSHNTRSSTRGNFFLEYSRLDKQNMYFSRNGVRIWNNLSNEIRQMPKVIFNIHNMLLQKLSEANEYIDLLDLNMPWKLN